MVCTNPAVATVAELTVNVEQKGQWLGFVAERWSRSTKLLYAGPG